MNPLIEVADQAKAFVVFRGRRSGVFTKWVDTFAQITRFKGSVVRVYETKEMATAAWAIFNTTIGPSTTVNKATFEHAMNSIPQGIAYDILDEDITGTGTKIDWECSGLRFSHYRKML